jgi:hypothetical protein
VKRENIDPYWHRARIAARIWLKAQRGKPLSRRDKRLARLFAEDKGVTNRLIEQARVFVSAPCSIDENLNFIPHAGRVVVAQH